MPFFNKSRRRNRRGRRFTFVLAAGLLFGAAIFFAPQLLVRSPLKRTLVQQATADLNVSVNVGTVEAGWLAPLVVQDIVVIDGESNQILEVESVRTRRSLLKLLTSGPSDLELTIERPKLQVVLRPDGSNLEDIVASWDTADESSAPMRCRLEVLEGTINAYDTTTDREWKAEDLAATIDLTTGDALELDLNLASEVHADTNSAGTLETDVSLNQNQGSIELVAGSLPLAVTEPLLRRFDRAAELGGTLEGRVVVKWNDSESHLEFEELEVRTFALRSEWLQEDRLLLDTMKVTGAATTTADKWQLKNVRLSSDLLNGRLDGDGDFASPQAESGPEFMSWLPRGAWKAEGEVDLAKLSQQLPQTLRLRPGTRLTSGRVTFQLTGAGQGPSQRWNGTLQTDALAAQAASEEVRWDNPLAVAFALHAENGALRVDQFDCDAGFLAIQASGAADSGNLEIRADIDRFSSEAGQFIDLGHQHVAGQLAATAGWKQTETGELTLEADARADEFVWLTADHAPWREKALEIHFEGTGRTDGTQLTELTTGSLSISSAQDRCHVQLTQEVPSVGSQGPWPLRVALQGNLDSWIPRLRLALPIDGEIDLQSDLTLAGSTIEFHEAKTRLVGMNAEFGSWAIREREVEVTTQGSLNLANGSGAAEHLTLISSSVAFRAEDVSFHSGPALAIAGRVGYRADLGKIWSWSGTEDARLAGQVVGQAQLAVDPEKFDVSWTTNLENAEYSVAANSNPRGALAQPGWAPLWSEKQVTVAGQLRRAGDRILLDRVEVQSAAFQMDGSGSVSDLSDRCNLELKGKLSYDFEELTRRFGTLKQYDIQLAGNSSQPFSFQGPLRGARDSSQLVSLDKEDGPPSRGAPMWTEMLAAAKLDWTSAIVQRVRIGEGSVESNLRDGVLTFTPVNVTVSDGQVMLAPEIDLRRDPIMVHLPAGPLAERVAITQEMCNSWLKYLAPLVADATAVQGLFSVTLEDSTMPVNDPTRGNVRGTLDVHSVQVGPGALSLEFLRLANQIKTLVGRGSTGGGTPLSARWIQLPEQRVQFRVRDNRVHHEGLQVVADDVTIRTSGSVGIDGSLALIAAVPIRDEWVANDRWLSSLRGQVIQVPIRGTFSNPQLDARVLDQMAKQFLGGAASRLLEQELGRGLDRLFGPRE